MRSEPPTKSSRLGSRAAKWVFLAPGPLAFAEWARTIGKQILTDSQYELVTNMHLSVLQHEVAKTLLADGIPEGVVRTEYCGVPCQIRMDWYDAFAHNKLWIDIFVQKPIPEWP